MLLQLPTIALVERLRARRAIAVVCLTVSRALLIPLALLPMLGSPALAQGQLVALTGPGSGLGAMAACAWNSWIHDLLPRPSLGGFFAQRQRHATAWSMLAGLAAGVRVLRVCGPLFLLCISGGRSCCAGPTARRRRTSRRCGCATGTSSSRSRACSA